MGLTLNLPLRLTPSTKKGRLTGEPSSPIFTTTKKTCGRFQASLFAGRIGNLPSRLQRSWEASSWPIRTHSPYFRNNSTFSGFNRRLSGTNTAIGTALVPASFYALGLVRKDSYATHTALLAGESAVDAEILAWVLRNATGRLRPSAVPPGGNYSDTWFETYKPILRAGGSFPSDHAAAAFSVATVFAHRYGNHRWVPWVAYGAATLVGVSRVTLQAHFPSDVFAGAAFGYLISRFIVMPGREPEP